MAEPDKNSFLDDIEEAEADEQAIELEEPDEAATDLDAVLAERDELREKFMRALADAENARKRALKDRQEAEKYGGSKLARDLLPVYDNLKRAIESGVVASDEDAVNEDGTPMQVPQDDDAVNPMLALIEGVELTMRELLNVFNKYGIELISPQVGDKFDPQQHQAMFEAPVPGTTAGEIIQVSADGFLMHDRLLRPAQVGVSSNPG